MPANRSKLRKRLAFATAIVAVTGNLFVWCRFDTDQSSFEKLHEGMTIVEVFDALHQNPDKCDHEHEEIGFEFDRYFFKSQWYSFPRYECGLVFVNRELKRTGRREVPLLETSQELQVAIANSCGAKKPIPNHYPVWFFQDRSAVILEESPFRFMSRATPPTYKLSDSNWWNQRTAK